MRTISAQLKDDFQRSPLYAGCFAVLFIAAAMTISSLGFWFDMTPGAEMGVASVFVALVATLLLARRNHLPSALLGVLIALFFLLASVSLSGLFVDLSLDGNSYHKTAVVALREGWNPLRESIVAWDRFSEIFFYQTSIPLWVDHYAQGLWQFCAIVYDATASLEQAKAYTLFSMCAAGSVLLFYLRQHGFKRGGAFLIALAAAANPITLVQFETFYCDGFLMMELLSLLIGLIMLADPTQRKARKEAIAIVVCSFIICANTKFTGLAYAGVFTLSFCILYILRWRKRQNGFSTKETATLAAILLATLAFSVCVVGYSSYVSNFLEFGNPLYPLAGEGKIDIMTPQAPAMFSHLSSAEKLFYSFFSQVDNIVAASGENPILKIPLSVAPHELEMLGVCDLRISGFGVFYSAILLVVAPVYIAMIVWSFKHERILFEIGLAFAIPSVLLMLLLSDSWWARYSSYAYFFNIFALVFLGILARKSTSSRARTISKIVLALLAMLIATNSLFFVLFGVKGNYDESCRVREEMNEIETQVNQKDGELHITYENMAGGIFPGQIYSLDDANIPYTIEEFDQLPSYDPVSKVNMLMYRFVTHDEAASEEPAL